MSIESWSDKILKVELQDDPAFSDDMTSLFEQADANKNISAVLNFEGVNYLNSSNIAKLLKLRKKLLSNRGKMVRCGINTNVWGLFLVTCLDTVVEFLEGVATGPAGVQCAAVRFGARRRAERAAGGQRAPDHGGQAGCHQVRSASGARRRREEHVLDGGDHSHPDPHATREVRGRRRHAPMVAAAGRLFARSQYGPQHHSVGAGDEGLAEIAAAADTTIGNDGNVAAALAVVLVTSGGTVQRGGHLRNADAEHLS